MGTITRTFANNITTSGVFKPTAFNNASFDNVTAVPSGSVEGGNMVLLSTQTASSSASISFTSGITSTYKEYMFIFNSIHSDSGGTTNFFTFNGSTDSGSNYNVTKTTTQFGAYQDEAGTASGLFYETSNDLAQSTAYQYLNVYRLNDAVSDESLSGTLQIFNPSDTTYVKHFIATTNNSNSGSYTVNSFTAGYFNTTSALNAFDFKMNTNGNFSGTIQMFGIL